MKGKAIIPLALGLVVGIVAVRYLVDALQKARGSNADQHLITVVQATQDIDSFEKITADMVKLIETADSDLIPARDRCATLEEVVDRVAGKSIPQDSPVLKSMLTPEGTPPGMRGRIDPGYRAVSVKIDEVTGVAYQIHPGDWVDVIVVMDVDSAVRGRRRETIAQVILQHVKVLAMGQGTAYARPSKGASVKPARSATLLVAEEDAPKLHLAATRGKITLTMRGADDTISEFSGIARDSEVFANARGEIPTPRSKPTKPTSDPSMLDKLMSKIAEAPAPEPEYDMPHGITVYRSSSDGRLDHVERVTFQNSRSREVVAVSEGPISNTQSMMLGQKHRSRGTRQKKSRRRVPLEKVEKDFPTKSHNEEAE